LITAMVGVEHFSETHWKSLRYFNLYRCVVATLLFTSALLYPSALPILSPNQSLQHVALASAYLLSTTLAVILAFRHRQHATMQLTASVLVDVLVMTLLIHIGGGLDSGLGSMLLVTLAGAGLVGQGRLVLFYAAMATLAVLFEHSYRALQDNIDVAGFFHDWPVQCGLFAVAISARLLANRVIANEELARSVVSN
jgi:two-component system sensor histidine kinase PilS (NtrC family)